MKTGKTLIPALLFFWVSCLNMISENPLFAQASPSLPADSPAPAGWPEEAKTVYYLSSADNTPQPAVFYAPEQNADSEPIPLIVGLHTWSHDFRQKNTYFFHGAKKRNWAMICPNFRGRNDKPEACGSELAVADIVSAVEYAKSRAKIDPSRVYLMGCSGGGYGSMLLAARHPEIWAGVCEWAGIADLADWYRTTKEAKLGYWKHLASVCGGAPGESPEIDKQYAIRSPLTHLANASSVPLSINHGIHDGHNSQSVPVSHAIRAFNLLAKTENQITGEQMNFIVSKAEIPADLKSEPLEDSEFGRTKILFRRSDGNVRLTIFDGGHTLVAEAGFEWLARQRKGQPADWSVKNKEKNDQILEIQSGK